MGEISRHIYLLQKELPAPVTLVAVSKFHPETDIQEAYDAGQRIFGESRVQELVRKQTLLPKDIQWHFIGHLQRNKVKLIVPFISLIHSIDSYKLLEDVNRSAAVSNKTVDCLLQIHIANEETKFGFSYDECLTTLKTEGWANLNHIRLRGLMGMATFTGNKEQVKKEFEGLKSFFDKLKKDFFIDAPYFDTLSMGMSEDYPEAITAGSTMVRIGSIIFGERDYN